MTSETTHPARQELSKEDVNALPIRIYDGPVTQVWRDEEVPKAVRALGRDGALGFDTETRPAFQRGVSYTPALLQLASATGVWLFSLQKISYPNALWALLENPAILKTGVSLDYDLKKLQDLHPFTPAGFLDLTELSAPLGMKAAGLRNLAANLLGFRIAKGTKTSNWERFPLSPAQVAYAATDAWIGREIYLALKAESERRPG